LTPSRPHQDPRCAGLFEKQHKLTNDTAITRIGEVLLQRQWDEFPPVFTSCARHHLVDKNDYRTSPQYGAALLPKLRSVKPDGLSGK